MGSGGRCDAAARLRHQTLDLLGFRSHATSVGLIQLCEELVLGGILTPEALERIKAAIQAELTVCNARISNHEKFDASLRRSIDAVFSQAPLKAPTDNAPADAGAPAA